VARTFAQMAPVIVLAAAFGGGIVPLVDSATVEAVRREEGHSYARTRLWGSVGFVLSAQSLGFLLAFRGDRPADRLMPLSYLAFVIAYAILAQTFPATEAQADRPHMREALALLRNPRLLFLL